MRTLSTVELECVSAGRGAKGEIKCSKSTETRPDGTKIETTTCSVTVEVKLK